MRLNNEIIHFFYLGSNVYCMCCRFSIQSIALDPDFYTTRYEQMELASDLNVSNQDLNDSIIVLLDYIQDKRQDMDITITRNGTGC